MHSLAFSATSYVYVICFTELPPVLDISQVLPPSEEGSDSLSLFPSISVWELWVTSSHSLFYRVGKLNCEWKATGGSCYVFWTEIWILSKSIRVIPTINKVALLSFHFLSLCLHIISKPQKWRDQSGKIGVPNPVFKPNFHDYKLLIREHFSFLDSRNHH